MIIPRWLLLGSLLIGVSNFIVAGEEPAKPEHKPYALIFGTVYDAGQHAVYGVKIKIRRADEKKARYEHITDHRGEFAQRVPVGPADYVVWAEGKTRGHAPPEAKVHIAGDERQDVSLHLTK